MRLRSECSQSDKVRCRGHCRTELRRERRESCLSGAQRQHEQRKIATQQIASELCLFTSADMLVQKCLVVVIELATELYHCVGQPSDVSSPKVERLRVADEG